jgi:hypothetical protein
MKSTQTASLLATSLAGVVSLTGCHSIGPRTVAVDRSDYSQSIADSWKQQTLLNIVKLRYLDLPVFMDVSSVVAGYSLQTGISAGGIFQNSGAGGNTATVGGSAVYTDRPTITYTPMTGQKFLHNLITPIDPKSIFFMLRSGYAADYFLALTLESLNGLHNRSTVASFSRKADPAFIQVLQLLREVQVAGAVHVRAEENPDKTESTVVYFSGDDMPPEILDKIGEIRRLLKLPEGQAEFKLVYSSSAGRNGELGVGTRSMLQIMSAMASYTDVPIADLKDGTALTVPESSDSASMDDPVKIKCSPEKPAHAFAMVHYRNQWFWVDDHDARTKRVFTSIMFLFTMMSDSSGEERLPTITIPAQ